MVSSVGSQLAKNQLITGFGIKRRSTGKGIARNATAAVVKMVGNALVNKISDAIKGGSYKLSGMGKKAPARKPRKPRATLKHKIRK